MDVPTAYDGKKTPGRCSSKTRFHVADESGGGRDESRDL